MSDSGPGRREVAYRLFAAEFDDAEFSYSESDEERAPNYVVTPTGARVNRLFAVGVLTEVDDVNPEMVRGRLVDPTGAFVTYAGQYQPDELAFLERAETPSFIALSGKARTFEPDDSDQIFTSVRPESVSEVDAETRDRWVLTAAERTIERVGIVASAIEADLAGDQLRAALVEAGVDDRLADGVALALEYYDTTPAYLAALRETALDAVRVVAGEKDEVGRLDVGPREGIGDASELATLDLSGAPTPETAAAAAGVDESADTAAGTQAEGEDAATETADSEPEETAVLEESETEDADSEAVDTEPEVTEAEKPGGEESAAETVETEDPGPEPDPVSDPVEEEAPESGDTTEPGPEPDEVEAVEEEMEDFDPGEFDLDEEERREVEEEYGTEFSTADEVEPADIEPEGESASGTVTEPDEEAETAEAESEVSDADTEPETDAEAESETSDATAVEAELADGDSEESEPESEAEEPEPESQPDSASETDAEDLDLSEAVMTAMKELADGDGADQEELVATVADEQGVAEDEVEEAIQDALMSGQCYEPSDGVLKPI